MEEQKQINVLDLLSTEKKCFNLEEALETLRVNKGKKMSAWYAKKRTFKINNIGVLEVDQTSKEPFF